MPFTPRWLVCFRTCLLRLSCTLGQRLHEMSERAQRLHVTRLRPRDELGYVHPAIARLAVVNPRLRLAQPRTQVALREPALLAERAKEPGQLTVARGVLRLGHGRR